jgi:hypothetical protein
VDHREYRVPITRRRRRAEQLVDLAQIPDRLHVASIHAEDKSFLTGDHAHEPFAVRGKPERNCRRAPPGFRQDAHEANHVGVRLLGSEGVFFLQLQQITAVTQRDFRCEWQFPTQFSAEFRARSRSLDDQGAGGAHVHSIEAAQFPGKDTGAKPPVPADVDPRRKTTRAISRHWARLLHLRRFRLDTCVDEVILGVPCLAAVR